MLLRFLIVLSVVIITIILQPGVTGAASPSGGTGGTAQLTVRGVRVSTEAEAKKIAVDAYFKKTGGLRGVQTAKVVSIHTLDLDIKGFAQKSDRVWEVRIYGPRDLRAIIWVHAQSAKTYFLVPRD